MMPDVREDIKKLHSPWARILITTLFFFCGIIGGLFLKNENDLKKEYRQGISNNQIRCDSIQQKSNLRIEYLQTIIDTLYMGYKRGNEQVKEIVRRQQKHLKK